MLYEGELKLFCDTFKKCRVPIKVLSLGESVSALAPEDDSALYRRDAEENMSVREFLGEVFGCTVYRGTDEMKLCYTYFLLPTSPEGRVVFVGPYLREPISEQQILEISEANGISPQSRKYLEEYYTGIAVIPDDSPLLVMLNTFCEHIWESPSFTIVELGARQMGYQPDSINVGTGLDDTLVSMKAMEKRYSFENELIEAVSLGQVHKESILISALSEQSFERRVQDPIRNMKNYGIIMNTLLRKAAERGGVHPVHLDSVSSSFAQRIESMSSTDDGRALMHEMFRSYCKLVRKSTVKSYSKVVKQTVLLIDSDMSADLTLSSIAKAQGVSAGYLSSVFKKETGSTVSEYVREKRMKHAAHLLSTTQLQVQTVALNCGIMDAQYFSKLFKNKFGMTPIEYREKNNVNKQ